MSFLAISSCLQVDYWSIFAWQMEDTSFFCGCKKPLKQQWVIHHDWAESRCPAWFQCSITKGSYGRDDPRLFCRITAAFFFKWREIKTVSSHICPHKINMSPKKEPFQNKISSSNHWFSGDMLVLGEYSYGKANFYSIYGWWNPPRSSRVVLADMLRWTIVLLTTGLLEGKKSLLRTFCEFSISSQLIATRNECDMVKITCLQTLQFHSILCRCAQLFILMQSKWSWIRLCACVCSSKQHCSLIWYVSIARSNDLVKLEAGKLCEGGGMANGAEIFIVWYIYI